MTMETRSCSNTHFIQATRNGLVMKVRNLDSRGKPALLFKSLKDVYEAEDTRRLGGSASNSQGTRADSVFDKCQPPRLSVVERILWEAKPETEELVSTAYDDERNSDLDDNPTLRQIRKRCKTRKRKLESFTDDSNQVEETKKLLEEGSDLNEPLISLKSKLSKILKPKKNWRKRRIVSSSETSSCIKSEQNLIFSPSKQDHCDLFLPVKLEIPESECLGLQRVALADKLSINHNVDLADSVVASNETLKMVEHNNGELKAAEESEKCVTDKVSCEPISMLITTDERGVRLENSEISFQESLVMSPLENDAGNVIVQELSCQIPLSKDQGSDICSHSSSFSDMEEISGKFSGTSRVQADHSEIVFQDFSVLSPPEIDTGSIIDQGHCCEILPSKHESLDTFSNSKSYSNTEEICGKRIETSSVQVSDITVDVDVGRLDLHHGVDTQLFGNKAERDLPYKQDGLVTDPERHCSSSLEPDASFKANDHIASMKDIISIEEHPSTSVIPRNGLNSRDHLDDELSISQEKQTFPAPNIVGEKKLPTNNQTCDVDESSLTSMLHHPQRLLSTRKVVSPSSQERLCLALNSVNLGSDTTDHKCKGKLLFVKQTENKSSSVDSDIQNPKMTENHGGPVQVSQTKGTANPRRIFKKSQKGKGSPYKGNLETLFSRAPLNLSTACTSSKSCSESAIAFSQQQMRDTESLALKLLNELKSIKDVVEEKLLFEAYRNISLKNDAAEVKAVINNATKVEETARKWLSMMTRDCNRFCKIMKVTENNVPVSKNSVPRERKKIMFADEAGGELCHVKFIEDDMNCQFSDSKQE